MRVRIAAILGVFVVLLSAVECGIPFVYTGESPSDPNVVALLREALMHAGVSPDGIIVKSILSKFEVYRTAYKATYINHLGQTCYLKWRVNNVIGTQSPQLPICTNLATGSGYDVKPAGPVMVLPRGPVIVGQHGRRAAVPLPDGWGESGSPAFKVPINITVGSEKSGGPGTSGYHHPPNTRPPYNPRQPTYRPGRPTYRTGRPSSLPGYRPASKG
uniref:Uncharacterized protein n=1 Tax=Lygus hesperus TaxID=30085 RepID=A0A0K8STR8_LYGHE